MRAWLVLVLAVASLVGMRAGAIHECVPTTSAPELDASVQGIGQYYVNLDCPPASCEEPLSVWVYEEANGIEGLQRSDEVWDDTCHGAIPADAPVHPDR